MKKQEHRHRHFCRKDSLYIKAEEFVLDKGLSLTKLNRMSIRQIIKLAKQQGFVIPSYKNTGIY